VHGRQIDVGAFDTPKNPGQPIVWLQVLSEKLLKNIMNSFGEMLPS